MEKKISESTLIDYLYNELAQDEREKVEDYLKAHPEVRKELMQLQISRNLLQDHQPPEVEIPPMNWKPSAMNSFKNRRWIYALTSAAAVILLLISVAWINVHVSVQHDTFMISWGKQKIIEQQKEIEQLKEAQAQLEKKFMLAIDRERDTARQMYGQALTKISAQSREIQNIRQRQRTQPLPDLWVNYLNTLQKEQLFTMAELISQTSQRQQEYTEALLSDFAQYLEKQREKDLLLVEEAINTLFDETQDQHLETNMVLAKLIERWEDDINTY